MYTYSEMTFHKIVDVYFEHVNDCYINKKFYYIKNNYYNNFTFFLLNKQYLTNKVQ